MTKERAIQILEQRECCRECVVDNCTCDECGEAFEFVIQSLKQKPTTKNDLGVDAISREQALNEFCIYNPYDSIGVDKVRSYLKALPSVTPQEPKCKDCKWWKDSDGEYRRGCGAESQCPINRREVFEGNGYCYLFEPQESEEV